MFTLPSFIIIAATFLFIFLWHPLGMTAMIILQALAIAINLYTYTQTSWFTYILIMTFLSGMMIIFAYISSIVPNETMTKMPFFFSASVMATSVIALLLLFSQTMTSDFFNLPLVMTSLYDSATATIFKIFKTNTNTLAIILISYLLVVLIMVVKITAFNSGPLRSK
uniref:NADH dehydrogenase subunit 6 n=1 Tax=Stygobromus allegheniensis TaxID=1677011 RepID=A0A6C0X5M0_9CRUS|nr:NADH dehydrogenase subunit 6 [Stygobromus allegheniensis]QIC54428.1 NADH dehydrogenase subunit 6 [Stygobromus allegheniensis]